MQIKTAIIPANSPGLKFLPLSKAVPPEALPLAGEPLASYLVKEVEDSDITNVVFVLPEESKGLLDYFKRAPKKENFLKKTNNKELLKDLKRIEDEFSSFDFSFIAQEKPLGDGGAVLQAARKNSKKAVAVLSPEVLLEAKIPSIAQLEKIFKTSQKSIVGLREAGSDVPLAASHGYEVAEVEKIAHRLYKVKSIRRVSSFDENSERLVLAGRYILTPEVFEYLIPSSSHQEGRIVLADVLKTMLKNGKTVYGYKISGKWLDCDSIANWLKADFYFTWQHPKYGPLLKEWLKK